MTESQSRITRAISRALGPFLIIFGIAIAMKAGDFPLMTPAFFQDGVLVFVTASFTLAIGLALLAAHHHFGSLPALIVTVFAIATTLRGAILMLAPAFTATLAATFVRVSGAVYVPAVISLLAGAYLTFVGWLAKA
jgi:hypothetical protein